MLPGQTGVSIVNIGVGPSNAKTFTDHLAVLRPDMVLMIGHCAGLRNHQEIGDLVLATGYVRDDRVLDDMLLTVEGAPTAEGTRSSLMSCLRTGVDSLAALAEEAQVTIRVHADQDLLVAAPDTSLTRAIVAVVDNAIHHAPPNSVVDVQVRAEGRMALIRVTDQGSGITGVDPDHIFDRFAHGAETGRKRSFGLGLALASEVAHRFGGDIEVESTSSHGTTFALRFPQG
jgi:signal transduction histidine kinase